MASRKDSSGDDKGGLNKFGAFWQKVVSKAKAVTGDKTPPPIQEQLSQLTSEERNRLAAQMAASQLGLDTATREQVAKAIEAEMKRRHEERERRRKELIETTRVQLPWGKKTGSSASTSVKSTITTPVKSAVEQRKKQAPKPSMGASVYPIKFEYVKDAKGSKQLKARSAAEADPWDDSSWKPVAVGPIGPSLEEKRKEWLLKNSMLDSGKKLAAAPKSMKGQTGSPSPTISASTEVFGSQPTALQMDDEAVKEIHAHTLGQMLQNILLQAADTQTKGKGKAAVQSPKSTKSPPPKPVKKPSEMTTEELIRLMREDPAAWDTFTTQNTVISFGIVTPTTEDMDKAKKTKESKKQSKITFDTEVDVAKAPVGKDFKFNERLDKSTGSLKK